MSISQSRSHTQTHHSKVSILVATGLQFTWEIVKLLIFWLPDGSPAQIRIDTAENLRTVVVIPAPARTAEFVNLFVILTIVCRNFGAPILDTTENQRLVDLLASMKANLGTHSGVSLINLLHETCNLYDLEFTQ